jgi:hypothetical protein
MTAEFPFPPIGTPWPPVYELKVWGGYGADEYIPEREFQRLKGEWFRAMAAAGWTVVWVPADDIPANAANYGGQQ